MVIHVDKVILISSHSPIGKKCMRNTKRFQMCEEEKTALHSSEVKFVDIQKTCNSAKKIELTVPSPRHKQGLFNKPSCTKAFLDFL